MLVGEGFFTVPSSPCGEAYLIGGKCKRCGKITFPKKRICINCFNDEEIEEVKLSRRGRVYSFSVVRQAPRGYTAPYATLYVDLPEGVRVFAPSPLEVWTGGRVEIGKEVELLIEKVGETPKGEEIVGYKFRPV